MKALLAFLLTVLIASAQSYKEFAKEMGYETNYDTALKKAKDENKGLMVVIVTNNCPWCIRFEKTTLSDKTIDELIKKKYIPLIINKREGGFPPYLNTPLVPTTYIIDPKDEQSDYERMGFMGKAEFLELFEELELE
ncbi:thioredoxin family protein [Sulfurimonas crateris]|uniref:Thioredoxin family protein n=1 Tax=Sulfurimonas crateris TaxID=2574727 RepID=A0A4V5TMK5_9BACT|nr:thioredoxin family protein [Sulfurimonas crateris]TKI71023.1 thioredoxin family protein [Sulfurimonas crateris]